jgi:Bacterial archaeo-eukaryotic release factor family 3
MNLLSRASVVDLMRYQGATCLSLYLPTHRSGRETLQDPIRLKNLLKQASEQASAAGLDRNAVHALVQPLEEKIQDFDFWQHQAEGLAVFRSPDQVNWLQTPWTLPELCVVGQRFHLKPLLRVVSFAEDYLVLCVSARGVRLFHGDRESLADITPESAQAVFEADTDKRRGGLQMHSAEGAVYHGPGSASDAEKVMLIEQFRRADHELASTVTSLGFPVVLAGVGSTQSLYRPLSGFHSLLLEKSVAGNCESMSPQDLRKHAWPIAEEHFRALEEAAKSGFEESLARASASTDLEAILSAVADGRVDRLFVAVGRQVWGRFDPAAGRVHVAETQSPQDQDLLNEAALGAVTRGAKLHPLSLDRMPRGAVIAAVFRY